MPIPFMCFSCGKSVNVPDNYAGKKIKCKCGAVDTVDAVAVPAPVARPTGKSTGGGKNAGKRMSKKQREAQALEKTLGKDWKKKEKQEQTRIGGESQHWVFDALDVLRQGPVQAFWGFTLGCFMLCFGLHMNTWMPPIRYVRRIPIFFVLFGGFTFVVGFVLLVMGLMNKEKRAEHSSATIMGIIIGTVVVLCVMAGFGVWFVQYMQENMSYDQYDYDNIDDLEGLEGLDVIEFR